MLGVSTYRECIAAALAYTVKGNGGIEGVRCTLSTSLDAAFVSPAACFRSNERERLPLV